MASRRFKQFRYSLETNVVDLYMTVSFGASGAPTLVVTNPASNQGIASIVRNSAGNYTITLTDPYVKTMRIAHTPVSAAAPAAPAMRLISDSVSSLSSPSMVIQFANGVTATDPASGEQALIQITLKNSSIQ